MAARLDEADTPLLVPGEAWTRRREVPVRRRGR